MKEIGELPQPYSYEMPDRNLVIEWQFPNGIISRVEVYKGELPWRIEVMVSYSDDRPAVFEDRTVEEFVDAYA